MHRSFEITLPADTSSHNLYSLIVGTTVYGSAQGGTNETAITGAIPTDGIFPDRVQELSIIGKTGSGTIRDRNNVNTSGIAFGILQGLTKRSFRNTICLKDYYLKGAAGSEVIDVDIESN